MYGKSQPNHSVILICREKTDISISEKLSAIVTFKAASLPYTKSALPRLPVRAAELSGGGWMGPEPPHVRSRSYCSVETERERAFGTPSADPQPRPPPSITTASSSQSSQTQAKGVGCLDTAGGQAAGADRDQTEASIPGPSLFPQNKTDEPSLTVE